MIPTYPTSPDWSSSSIIQDFSTHSGTNRYLGNAFLDPSAPIEEKHAPGNSKNRRASEISRLLVSETRDSHSLLNPRHGNTKINLEVYVREWVRKREP